MGDHAVENDHLLIHAVIRTIECWESSRENGKEISIFKELKTFLLNRIIALDSKNPMAVWSSKSRSVANGAKPAETSEVSANITTTNKRSQCTIYCTLYTENHILLAGFEIESNLPIEQKQEQVHRSRACYNCLDHSMVICHQT